MPKPKSTAVTKSQAVELDRLAKGVREWHPEAKRFFSNFTFARFAIGFFLLRARAILPDSARGPKTDGRDDDALTLTFVTWKRQQFPDIPNRTLYDYQAFSARVLETFPKLEHFDVTKSISDDEREQLLSKLKSCISGKDVTLCLRAMGEIPEATPPGGDRGGRRPKKDIVREHANEQQRATESWNHICDEIIRESSLNSWKLVSREMRDRIIKSLDLANEIREWSNQ